MLDVVSITLPIFILISLGFASTWQGVTTPADIRALGAFVIRFALPALIFKSLSQRPFAEIVNADYLIAYTVGSAVVFASMFALARMLQPGGVAAGRDDAVFPDHVDAAAGVVMARPRLNLSPPLEVGKDRSDRSRVYGAVV
jgi:predicted permease